MTNEPFQKDVLASDRDVVFLYAAAFLLAFGAGHWWFALPFIVNRFQGSDTQVGMCLAAFMGTYALSVMIATPLVIRRNLKRILQVGALGVTISTLLMCIIVALKCYGIDVPHPIGLLIFTSALYGLCQAGFWPPLMGWLSTGCLGSQLNRRLSLFSISWASASFLCPYVAGRLVEWNLVLPMAASVAILVLTCLFVSIPAKPQATERHPHQNNRTHTEYHPLLGCFRWMSRIALFICFLSLGIMRTQFPIYVKIELGYKESIYGIFLTIVSVAMFANYILVGRTNRWQYRLGLFLAAQICLLLFPLTVLLGTRLYLFYIIAVLLGLGSAFCYSSHLYYGSAGGTNRYALMAIHEFTLASGFVIGALGGGALSDHYNRLTPYKFGAAVLTAAILVQMILFLGFRAKLLRAKKHPASGPNTGCQ